MPRVYAADSPAPPAEVWSLMAEPRRWAEWAPHVRGAWRLGAPEVEPSRVGAAKLAGVLPVPARIVAKDPGRSWTWRVGPMTLVHAVHPTPVGSRVSMTLSAPGPLEPVLAAAYGPVIQAMTRRLARKAAESSTSS